MSNHISEELLYEGVYLIVDDCILLFKPGYNVADQLKNMLLHHSFVLGKFQLFFDFYETQLYRFDVTIESVENRVNDATVISKELLDHFKAKIIK